MYSNITSKFRNLELEFGDDGGIITNCEELFLQFLPYIIKENTGKEVKINVVDSIKPRELKGSDVSITFTVGEPFSLVTLERLGLSRVERVWGKGEYSVLGDIIIIWPASENSPVRLSLFDNQIEDISYIDIETRQRKISVKSLTISNDTSLIYTISPFKDSKTTLYYVIGSSNHELDQVDGMSKYSVDIKGLPSIDYSDFKTFWKKTLPIYRKQGYTIFYVGSEADESYSELKEYFDDMVKPGWEESFHGFISPKCKVIAVCNADLLGQMDLSSDLRSGNVTGEDIFKRFVVGDYVVHEDHGIGIFRGIYKSGEAEYIELGYAGKDRLLIPFDQSRKISKFIGAGQRVPSLTGLNSGVWKRIKRGVENDVMEIAKDLVQIYALRALTKIPVVIDDYGKEKEYQAFIESFEFEDTEDQYVISNQILEDFKRPQPMDRLVVGDVGFGKTEVALRAVFAVLNAGMQVAILAPTTILSHQHYKNIKRRFEKYPFTIAELSRLVDEKEKGNTISQIEKGSIDLVIGTHSILQERVKFNNLGLIVVDEEQRFGVKQKEILKGKKADTHILSLTATPIPRTLSLALNGVREMSILASVPHNRKPIRNTFGEFEWERVVNAILLERERGGQTYYLHNKVRELNDLKETLEKLIPDLKVALVHGQMYRKKLNTMMADFIDRKYDVLLSTTIIENGLDLPNVNTLIVDDAQRYGLSQLYQIRGRIGRSDAQAYAYFMYNVLSGKSELRLDALKEAEDLGSGFLLSNRDLEIRGAGNILGKEQSGVINTVGYGLYTQMLRDAIATLKPSSR
ncbi:DEAD/DEAH box helicase [Candidatus Dojkabacteria bacterium]|nr:DEAD/DEAH box helicase [Candidatus Dojkabacteria bacterium]